MERDKRMRYFFIRVNGDTEHNNRKNCKAYVPDEPPEYPKTYYNYYEYCLKDGFIRIGWPDVGDLTSGEKKGALAESYSLESVKPLPKKYLLSFSDIPLKSIVLMPNKDIPGNLYIGEVSNPYRYYHDVPRAPYECAHRLGVNWDRDNHGGPRLYDATDLNIVITVKWRWWWRRAFHEITDDKITDVRIIDSINKARNQ